MNIANIEKVANRKRINAEAEKLRERVTRETANIIKLKVAQDTAYWDVKEKLHQLENNHERLQQNMVQVQMQHEAISGQYQDELRQRPETLNKLSSTRQICDVLEEYSSRLKATVSRCQADQATLADAYNKSGELVRGIKEQQLQAEDKCRQVVDNLQEKVKLMEGHKEQMAQIFSSSRQHLESELSDTRTKLAAALGHKDELYVALNDFTRKLDHGKRELERKDENIANLQMDVKKLILQLNNKGTEMTNLIAKHEKELKEYSASNECLKKALNNQEQFTRSICDQNNELQEKISALEEEQISISDKVKLMENKVEEANAVCDHLEKERMILNEKKEEFEKEISDKIMLLGHLEKENQNIRAQVTALEAQNAEKVSELESATQDSNLKSDKIEELTSFIHELETKLAKMKSALETLKAETAEKIKELNTTLDSKDTLIQDKDKELDCKASTINQLMSDLKNVTDAKTKLENNLEKLKKDLEVEKNSAAEKDKAWAKKVEQLDICNKDKEKELSRQMVIMLDMRNEKERLQGRLKATQSTIDNIEKEVTGRSAQSLPARQAAELDDNAVMMTPATLQKKVGMRAPRVTSPVVRSKEQAEQDRLLYNLFSDSSADNELCVDPEDINRRFEAMARGEPIKSPMRFKRGRGNSVTLGGLQPINKPASLSQARDRVKNKRIFFKSKADCTREKRFKPAD